MHRLAPLARRHALDALIALAALDAALEVALRDAAPQAPRSPLWFAVPAVAAIVLPLLARRRFPVGAPAAVWVLAAALSFADGRLVVFAPGVYAAGVAAAFLLGALRDPARARAGLAIALVSSAVVVVNDPNRTPGQLVSVPALFGIAWLGGLALRSRAAHAEAAEHRALQAEREREAAARLAVAEERTRIARELHDIVAHAVSVMVLQAGAVRHRLPEGLAEEREALTGVERTGRTALAEMRRLLGAMRDDDGAPARAPQPGLDDLHALIDGVARAGLPVRLHVEGDAVALPRALDLSAYRIVQEGLTNALRHAGARRADVTVRYGGDGVQLEVRDDGTGGPADGAPGRGLVGIRERVSIYGGEMAAGRAPDGGFVLRARLPFEAGAT